VARTQAPRARREGGFALKSGKIVLDAFNAIPGAADGPVDTTPIRSTLDEIGSPAQADYTADSWALFDSAFSAAKAAVTGQKGLDVIGVEQIRNRLDEAYDRLVRKDTTQG
jgi:hypothetical protein